MLDIETTRRVNAVIAEAFRPLLGDTVTLGKRAADHDEDGELVDMQKASGGEAAPTDDDSLKAALETTAAITGVSDPDELAEIMAAALRLPIDVGGRPSDAVGLAKSVLADGPMGRTVFPGLSAADVAFSQRLDRLTALEKHSHGYPVAGDAQRARQENDVLPLLRALKPTTMTTRGIKGAPAPVDRREELRQLVANAQEHGQPGIAAMWKAALAREEAKIVLREPTGTISWG